MENTEKLQKKLKSIKCGAYWFGIIGRLSIVIGAISVFFGIFAKLTGYSGDWLAPSIAGISALINGYLFLFGRDAFEAIEDLIREARTIA